MRKPKFKYTGPGCDRRHYINESDVTALLSRMPEETWRRLRAVHFNDSSLGVRILGHVERGHREISICALPPRVSLTRFLVKGQTCEEFGARRGAQWPHLAIRRFLLYLNPPKNTPSIALAWMEMNSASWALRPRLNVVTKLADTL